VADAVADAVAVAVAVADSVAVAVRSGALLNLRKIKLDGRGPSENRNVDLELLLVRPNLGDGPGEVREVSVDDADLVADLERNARLRFDRTFDDDLSEIVDLRRLHLLGTLVTDEAGDLRRLLDEVPRFFGHLHLDEDVTGEAVPLFDAALPVRPR